MKTATTECRFGGGLNSSSGGELRLYLGCTGSTLNLQKFAENCMKMKDFGRGEGGARPWIRH